MIRNAFYGTKVQQVHQKPALIVKLIIKQSMVFASLAVKISFAIFARLRLLIFVKSVLMDINLLHQLKEKTANLMCLRCYFAIWYQLIRHTVSSAREDTFFWNKTKLGVAIKWTQPHQIVLLGIQLVNVWSAIHFTN
jgi:hypothetical protein